MADLFIGEQLQSQLKTFAEHHFRIGVEVGRSQMLREIADRDIEKIDASDSSKENINSDSPHSMPAKLK